MEIICGVMLETSFEEKCKHSSAMENLATKA
jgi:hypothetical protein